MSKIEDFEVVIQENQCDKALNISVKTSNGTNKAPQMFFSNLILTQFSTCNYAMEFNFKWKDNANLLLVAGNMTFNKWQIDYFRIFEKMPNYLSTTFLFYITIFFRMKSSDDKKQIVGTKY